MFALTATGTEGALPIALGGAVLMLVAWGVGTAFGHGRRAALWAALATCLAVIGWITIGLSIPNADPGSGGVNLTVFQEIQRALDTGAREPWMNLIGNVVLFAPLGAVVATMTRRGWALRVLTATFLAGALSALIEAVQFVLGRVADVDDVILNTAGALIGAVIAATVIELGEGARSAPTAELP